MNQVAQGDARLALAFETHQNGFRHVQRHDARSSGEGHQARTGRERNAQREAGVRVTASTHGIRQQHAVQPAVDDAVAGAQRDATTVHDEVRQGVVSVHIYWLRICRRVAEGLHDQIGLETKTSKIFQLVAGHRASGVLGAYGGHLRFAVHAGTNAVHAASLTHHLLR